MTTRICVIGNSHVNALKTGWADMASEQPNFDMTFFASKGDRLGQLDVQDGCLVTQDPELRERLIFTSGGLDHIQMTEYDWFLVYGMQLRPGNIRMSLSEAVKSRIAQDILEASVNHQTMLKIRTACSRPIVIGHNPLRHTKSRNVDDFNYSVAMRHLHNALDLQDVYLLGQPAETIENDRLTKAEYGIGATKLKQSKSDTDVEKRIDDLAHMNRKFGALYLHRLLDHITRTEK